MLSKEYCTAVHQIQRMTTVTAAKLLKIIDNRLESADKTGYPLSELETWDEKLYPAQYTEKLFENLRKLNYSEAKSFRIWVNVIKNHEKSTEEYLEQGDRLPIEYWPVRKKLPALSIESLELIVTIIKAKLQDPEIHYPLAELKLWEIGTDYPEEWGEEFCKNLSYLDRGYVALTLNDTENLLAQKQ